MSENKSKALQQLKIKQRELLCDAANEFIQYTARSATS